MRLTITLFTCLVFFSLSAQTFNSPESVEYDAANNRWLVGNKGLGTIVSCNPAISSTNPFASGMSTGPNGVEILGNVAYSCDGAYIKGFDLSTGTQSFSLNLSATFLNGLTTDGTDYLFATDMTAKKIFRIRPSNNTFDIMCSTTLSPNGIYYDGANNRCVFVTWGAGASIQAMSLADSTVSTLISTAYSNFDGITRDLAGYWYATSWGNNSLIRWTPSFTTPTVVMSGLNGPADIDINAAGDSIGIPNMSNSTVVYYTGINTGITVLNSPDFHISPNPSTSICTVSFNTTQFNSKAVLMDASGRVVRTVGFSDNKIVVEKGNLETGIYLLNILNENGNVSAIGKIIFE